MLKTVFDSEKKERCKLSWTEWYQSIEMAIWKAYFILAYCFLHLPFFFVSIEDEKCKCTHSSLTYGIQRSYLRHYVKRLTNEAFSLAYSSNNISRMERGAYAQLVHYGWMKSVTAYFCFSLMCVSLSFFSFFFNCVVVTICRLVKLVQLFTFAQDNIYI